MNSQRSIHRNHQIKMEPGKKRQDATVKSVDSRASQILTASERAVLNPVAAQPQDILRLQNFAGNQAVSGLIQAKLRVGPVGDAFEQQADRVADQVVQSPAAKQFGALQRDAATSNRLQLAPAHNQTAQKSGFVTGQKTEQHLQGLRGSGQPLPVELRREMEMYMGADLSEVRLHTNSEASRLNRRLAARAFTQGKDIYMDSGEYNPASREGKRLLAHELTHVLQQTGKRPPVARLSSAGVLGKQNGMAARSLNAAGASPQTGVVQRYKDEENEQGQKANYVDELELGPEEEEPQAQGEGYADELGLDESDDEQEEQQGEKKLPHSRLAIDLAKRGDNTPDPLKLPEKYKDEQKKRGWRSFQGAKEDETEEQKQQRAQRSEKTDIVTKHFSDTERQRYEFNGGTADFEPRIYAMNPQGRIVTGTGGHFEQEVTRPGGQKVKEREHHSSMFSGQDVAHAGHIGVKEGKINYLDDDSGHYRPTAAHTWDAYNRLKKGGMLADIGKQENKVSMVDKSLQKGVDANYAASKLELPFYAYEQTHGNEEQARNKKAMLGNLTQWWQGSKKLNKPQTEGGTATSDYKERMQQENQEATVRESYGTQEEDQPQPDESEENVDIGYNEDIDLSNDEEETES